jgi:hypothetical protein
VFLTVASFTSSPPFTIIVGESKKKFYIHSALLSSLSAPLSRLVNNGIFKESREAQVSWEHVDEDTFAYFVQYAYTFNFCIPGPPHESLFGRGLFGTSGSASANGGGSISVAEPATTGFAPTVASSNGTDPPRAARSLFAPTAAPTTASAASTTATVPSLFANPSPTPATAAVPSKSAASGLFNTVPTAAAPPKDGSAAPGQRGHDVLWAKLTASFADIGPFAKLGTYRPVAPARQPPSTAQKASDKVPNPLVAHARLFLFADYYDIGHLSDISFRRMGQCLLRHYSNPKSFEQDWQMNHVIELIEFCWGDDRPAKLREAMMLYVACRMEMLWDKEAFRQLAEEKGEFAMDLLAALASRLKVI